MLSQRPLKQGLNIPSEERFPFRTVTIPVIFREPRVPTPAGLFIIRFLIVLPVNILAPKDWSAEPFISIVPSVAENDPLLVIVPDI